MERLISSGTIYQDLQIPQWWGYAVAFVQMSLTSLVAAYRCYAHWCVVIMGKHDFLKADGSVK